MPSRRQNADADSALWSKRESSARHSASLRRVRFAGLLEDLIVRFKAEVAQEKYKVGVENYDQGNFDKADEAFIKSLEYNETPDYLGMLLYYQGMSALRLKDFRRSADLLQKALEFKHDNRIKADARYHLAYSYDRMNEKRTARDLYYRFFNRHENHPFAPRAKHRYKQLKED